MVVEAPSIRRAGLDPPHARRQEAIGPAALRLWQGRAFFSMAVLYLFYYFGKKNRPGVTEAVEELRQRRIPLAVNTGYNREMLEVVLGKAAEGGFIPDAATCAADIPKGRPAPWMVFRLVETLNVYPPAAVVKVGDTVADVEEGLNAGVWTVGVTRTGNLIGLTQTELSRLDRDDLERQIHAAERTLTEAGAHYVIESFADVPAVVRQIEERLRYSAVDHS